MSQDKFNCGLFPIVKRQPEVDNQDKFNCGLFPIVKRQPEVDTTEFQRVDTTNDTTEFPRLVPLKPWSPYIDYSEEKALQDERLEHEAFMSVLTMIGDAIAIAIIFTLLFMFS